MNTFSQLLAQKPGSLAAQDFLNRRIFLRNGAAALSAAALAGLLPKGAQASSPFINRLLSQFCPQGEAGDLPFSVGWTFPDGFV